MGLLVACCPQEWYWWLLPWWGARQRSALGHSKACPKQINRIKLRSIQQPRAPNTLHYRGMHEPWICKTPTFYWLHAPHRSRSWKSAKDMPKQAYGVPTVLCKRQQLENYYLVKHTEVWLVWPKTSHKCEYGLFVIEQWKQAIPLPLRTLDWHGKRRKNRYVWPCLDGKYDRATRPTQLLYHL